MGAPRALALCDNFDGALDFQSGHWQAAEDKLRRAAAMYRDIGSAAGESLSLQRLAVVLTARGAVDEAHGVLSDGLVVAERAAMRSHCLTRLHASMIRNRLAANDSEGVAVSLANGMEMARRHGDCVTCSALLLPEVVRAHIALGQLEAADASCEQLQRTAADFDSRVWDAMALQCRGRVLLTRGDTVAAAEVLARAARSYETAEQPYEVARCLALQARCADAGAAAAGARARDLLAELGAAGLE
jgi:ATP/maltotriose-dependent transcriptional regulator MalT